MTDFGYDSTTGRDETLDDWLEQWDDHGRWHCSGAEVQALVDEIARLREALADRRIVLEQNEAYFTEIGRLRTVVRLQEVALADWEKSYPVLSTETPPQAPVAPSDTPEAQREPGATSGPQRPHVEGICDICHDKPAVYALTSPSGAVRIETCNRCYRSVG